MMEELIKATEKMIRLSEDLAEAKAEYQAETGRAWEWVARMFGDVPPQFVYTSNAGDNYLITCDSDKGDILSVTPIAAVCQRDAAIQAHYAAAHKGAEKRSRRPACINGLDPRAG